MISLYFDIDGSFDLSLIPQQWHQYVSVVSIGNGRNRIAIDVQPEDSSYRYRALMQKPQLFLNFSLPFYFEFPVGTSCEFQTQTYRLMSPQNLKKQGTRKIEYTMTLGTDEEYMSMWKLRNVINAVTDENNIEQKDNRLKFSMCAKPKEFVDLLVRCLNDKGSSLTWVAANDCITADEKTVEFNHTFIFDALNDIATAFETEWEVTYSGNTATLHLHKVEYNTGEDGQPTPLALAYGRGNGFVPGVGRTTEADGAPVKRMYVQGSDRNIDRSKYGSPELLLPKSQTLEYEGRTYQSDADGCSIERIDKVSDAVKEDSLDCSEIYPSRVGRVSEVIEVNAEKNFYDFTDMYSDDKTPHCPNFNSYLIAGETMSIIFQDGMLAGKEFDVKYKHDDGNGNEIHRFEIVPQDFDGITMPNATFKPVAGNKYAVFGVMLPDEYICDNEHKCGASWDMFRKAAKSLYEAEEQKFTFSGELQGLWAKRNWPNVGGKLIVGGYVMFTDNQFAKDGVKIRITGIKDYLTQPYSPTIELSNSVSGSSVSSQLRQIDNTEVVIEETHKSAMQFTKRRFRDALETIGLLDDAKIGDFAHSISPSAVQTMAALVGDESLQFRFVTKSDTTTTEVHDVIGYDNATNTLSCDMMHNGAQVYLQHLTLGQSSITTEDRRKNANYRTWPMQNFTSSPLAEYSKSYYLYARVNRNDESEAGTFVMSETAISMEQEPDYYHLLVGILNSMFDNSRSFVTLYGFTEILPGRITTDIIISNDGNTYFDLANGEIGGALKFLSDNGYITIIDGGKIKTELIDVSQLIAKSVIVGDEDGERVQILPDKRAIEIFDADNNQCSSFEGVYYDGIDALFGAVDGGGQLTILPRNESIYGYASGVTRGRGDYELRATSDSNDEEERGSYALTDVFHTDTPTEIRLLRGDFYVYAQAASFDTYEDALSSQGNIYRPSKPIKYSSAYASLVIIVITFADAECTQQISSMSLAYAAASASSLNSEPYGDEHQTHYGGQTKFGGGDMSGKSVKVAAGYHRIDLLLNLRAVRTNSNAHVKWGFTDGSKSDIAIENKNDFYVSRYFANGFCLGTRNDNYILAWKADDGMNFALRNGANGIIFNSRGMKTKCGDNWMPMPMLIFRASITFSNGAYSVDSGALSVTRDLPTLTHTNNDDGKGKVDIVLPTSWATSILTQNTSAALNASNLIVHVNGNHNVIDARVVSIGTNVINVTLSDDASLNDGNFTIEIYYIAI